MILFVWLVIVVLITSSATLLAMNGWQQYLHDKEMERKEKERSQ